jgi:hypothetical protein
MVLARRVGRLVPTADFRCRPKTKIHDLPCMRAKHCDRIQLEVVWQNQAISRVRTGSPVQSYRWINPFAARSYVALVIDRREHSVRECRIGLTRRNCTDEKNASNSASREHVILLSRLLCATLDD